MTTPRAVKEVQRTKQELKAVVGSYHKNTKAAVGEIKSRVAAVESLIQPPTRPKTLGERLISDEQIGSLRVGPGRKTEILLEGGIFPAESKATIDSAALGNAVPGILTPQRVLSIMPAAQRRLTLRDIIPSRPTDSNAVSFVRENSYTQSASPQSEADSKAESAMDFVIDHETVSTISHWTPCSIQALDDLEMLRDFVDSKLIWGLKLKEESELLSGDGLDDHLNGLTTTATSYLGTYDSAGNTRIDKILHALHELADAEEDADFICLHPADWYAILAYKTAGAVTATYVVGDPINGGFSTPTLFGRNVIVSNSQAAGYFLLGNTTACQIRDRQQATVRISTQHDTYWTKNLCVVLCEERLTLLIFRSTAFVFGSFS